MVRSDFVDIDFDSGFAPGGFFRFQVDVDPDSFDAGADYRTVLFNNGPAANSVITVGFSDGTVLTQTIPDAAFQDPYTFTQSSPGKL